jgi:hypothetical protein
VSWWSSIICPTPGREPQQSGELVVVEPGEVAAEAIGERDVVPRDLLQALEVLVDVVRSAFPVARLDVPFFALRQIRSRGIGGGRLAELPVRLTPGSRDVRSGGAAGS